MQKSKSFKMLKKDRDYFLITNKKDYQFPDEKISSVIETIFENLKIQNIEDFANVFNYRAKKYGELAKIKNSTVNGWIFQRHCPRGRRRVLLEELYLDSFNKIRYPEV